jgi:2-C-methyl-D-erythritol 4-phosphate cytidylyltransferase
LKRFAIIVAGGTGTRMNAGIPKQFLLLAGRPMLLHSLDCFYLSDPETSIIVVLPENHAKTWRSLCTEHGSTIPHQVVSGGETRFHSVKNGLQIIPGDGLVAIHDGARPLVSPALINRAFEAASRLGNATPVLPVNESMRTLENGVSRPVNRDDYRIIQTPQVFGVAVLRKAYEQTYRAAFTDDATVFESTGETIHLIEGEYSNIKITRPDDLITAERIIRPRG